MYLMDFRFEDDIFYTKFYGLPLSFLSGKPQMQRISNHKLPIAENLLNQNFKMDEPNAVWATDSNMRTELCIKALENAVRWHKTDFQVTI